MRSKRSASGRDPPGAAREELLHESERTRVTRLVSPAGSVIRKEPLGPDAGRRLRHETEILGRLSGARGVVQLAAEEPPSERSILLADTGGTVLSELAVPVDPDELVRIAESLARAVAEMHRRGVVHRDINPANILVSRGRDALVLFDFALATTSAAQPEFAHQDEVVGTMAYLAPEQTGRTGRRVDQRADLYAVGATLYELATGTPPFGAGDPLRIIHDHLARRPVPPSDINPSIPAGLSSIIMHLLEKEPDDRYQSADGLVRDLASTRRGAAVPHPGKHDLPARPLTPSRLSGREEEIGELGAAFAEAMAGRCPGVLLSGAPGVGKTALANELRPIVAGNDGWYVAGKFDPYRRDQEYDGVRQAFRALGRLLLAEPDDCLVELRERLVRALRPNAGIISAIVPELAVLLEVPLETGDPMTAQARTQRGAVEILRAVASRKRPVVMFIDDLQWAARTPLGFVDLVFGGGEPIEGLLLVGAYREGEVDAAHVLAPMLARWRRAPSGPRHLRLGNLAPAGQAAMVADLLHLAEEPATELARLIAPHAGGNPYDTVELLGALRHDGVLTPGEEGWRWDPTALRRQLGRVDVTALLADHVAALPSGTREVLAVMACLAGRVELDVVAAATGLAADEVERRLIPAFIDGVAVLECEGHRRDGHQNVRFHHDRAQEAVLGGLTPRALRALRLRLARRLAARPEFFTVAAQQYLLVADAVHAAAEQRLMVRLFRRAADEARVLSNYPLVERLLTAAIRLVDPADTDLLRALHTDRHAALYMLGRLDDAEEEYRTISGLCGDPAQRTSATVVQVSSLTNQGRAGEAMRLGLDQLRRLGLAVPDSRHLDTEIDRALDALYPWMGWTTESDDLRRPEVTDRSRTDAITLVNRLMPPAFFCDQAVMAWLTLQALRMWAQDGPERILVGPASHLALVTIARGGDYHTGYRLARRILTVAHARGYEPDVWQAQFLYVLSVSHWFEPLEATLSEARRALEGLLQGGDLQNACWTHYPLVYDQLDCAPTIEDFVAEVDEALAVAARTGNDHAEETFRTYQRLARVLRGEAVDSTADERAQLGTLAANPVAAANLHITRALAAAILDHPAELIRHTAAVMPLLPSIQAHYATAVARLLRALALAGQARAAEVGQHDTLLAELDETIAWLAARAADAPANFLHLLRLVEAERAWAAGAFREAIRKFDAAQRECSGRARPWHRALILERAARCYLAHGVEETGHMLLSAARRQYLAWGATAKVSQLDWAYPTPLAASTGLGTAARAPAADRRATVTTGTIDLLGIVATSQALSSQTSVEGLRAKVAGILSTMTGATGVHLLLRDQGETDWRVIMKDGGTIPLREARQRRLIPHTVVRYAERTSEPVVLADAVRDDRFRRDPYFVGLDRCALLAVPITIRGALRAMLLLENRMIRGAFSAERLEGIMLIAGQLAVSLDNALVYESLERKVAERTRQLCAANERLEQLTVTDQLTGLANRRRLDEVLDAEWRRAGRQAAPIALAMVDVDYFKLYNDHFGHTTGDRCLRRVAACLARNTRDTDLAARYGGEEFAVVMPGADLAVATRLARHLCTAVTDLAEPHPLAADGIVTVSVGVTAITPAPGDDKTALVEVADAALYRAKHSGRNRVEAALARSRVSS
ncbi:diguanylate cyclase [Frankia sp. CNm7]|uniref:Diguanylate cyclase n=1 Tax=Frankia nepalensis TaxID=1836974 RepID=A0A937UQ47_9ACTN|nr:diguanylate cyclase [Frankia nepalensis]MBL7498795.1 diguanylate cyclase [Frankia nepalensis]MBL7508600.1 diguanylate cyclase [Frankia nepalensis]MBL7517482.1 diguanylate cyclase [Frankia nepalensis]MBL7629728.1 diguanylate cyclase [Frankia nepalensis]